LCCAFWGWGRDAVVFLGAEVMEIDSELRVKKRPAFPLSLCLTYYSIDEM
jgi:hypothetical protein